MTDKYRKLATILNHNKSNSSITLKAPILRTIAVKLLSTIIHKGVKCMYHISQCNVATNLGIFNEMTIINYTEVHNQNSSRNRLMSIGSS